MKRRMASGAEASSSRRLASPPQDKEDDENVIYSCALEVASTLDTSKFKTFIGRYQIPSEFKPRLPKKKGMVLFSFFIVWCIYLLPFSRF